MKSQIFVQYDKTEVPINFQGHWWIHLKVISNLRPYDLNSLSFSVMVFKFEFDLYRKFIDHYERCILVHYYHSCQFKFKSIPNIVFQSHCTQTHTHIHLHINLQKTKYRVLI